MRRTAAAAVVVVGAAAILATVHRIQNRSLPSLGPADRQMATGTFHIHSALSHDSELDLSAIVAAAKQAGLDFVVLSDHNAQYAGPMLRDGILVLSTAELSTPFGHVVQLGADPVLSGAQRQELSVLHDVRALGGFPIIAHPADRKRPWSGPWADAAGLEIANLASSTRRAGGPAFVGLLPALAALPLNRNLALAQTYDRDEHSLALWDAHDDPHFVGLCGVDAHGWISLAHNLAAWEVVLEAPLPTAPQQRAPFVLEQLTQGRFFCNAGLLGGPPRFLFGAKGEETFVAKVGDTVPTSKVDSLYATITGVQQTPLLVLFRNGAMVFQSRGTQLRYRNPAPGTYRVEVWLPIPGLLFGERHVPVIYSGRLALTATEPHEPESAETPASDAPATAQAPQ